MADKTYIEIASPALQDIQIRGYWIALRPVSGILQVWVRLAPPHREYPQSTTHAPPHGIYHQIPSLAIMNMSDPWLDSSKLEDHIDEFVKTQENPAKPKSLSLPDPDSIYEMVWVPDEEFCIRYVYRYRFQQPSPHVEISFYGASGVGNIPLEAPLPSTPRSERSQAATIMGEHWGRYSELLKSYLADTSETGETSNALFRSYLERLKQDKQEAPNK